MPDNLHIKVYKSLTIACSLKTETFLTVVFVIQLQLPKISINTSRQHSYFEEFTLWILISKLSVLDTNGKLCRFF